MKKLNCYKGNCYFRYIGNFTCFKLIQVILSRVPIVVYTDVQFFIFLKVCFRYVVKRLDTNQVTMTGHVLGLDVGTTTVRGLVYSESGEVQGQARATIQPIIPGPGCYEIDPDTLWDQVRL